MHFDLWVPTAAPFATPEFLRMLGTQAEDRGIHRIWVGEHVVLFDEYDSVYPYAEDGRIPAPRGTGLLEPIGVLAYLAAQTTSVRLGTAMLLLPQRNPVYTAKEVATLDWLSGGRVDLGIGVGWLREEFAALGVPFEARGKRTDEYLDILTALWHDDPSSYAGETYTLPACSMFPKPIQTPILPIHIGGESDAALRRAARRAQGWHTFNRSPADLSGSLRRLDELLDEQHRTRGELEITVCPYFEPLTPESVEQYAEAGADSVAALFFAAGPDGVEEALDALEPCMTRAKG